MVATSSERAYRLIRGDILAGRFVSGQRLKEETIAGELAISRTPVRDAIRRLEAEGLVEVTPNSGAKVASWTEGELAEITEMRARLESFAAELAATKITGAEIDALTQLSDGIENAIKGQRGPDLDRISAENLAFHEVIVRAAGNGRLLAMVQSLHSLPVVIRKFALFDRERLERSASHHREIISALKARDRHWAGSIMHTHILAAKGYDRLISETVGDGAVVTAPIVAGAASHRRDS